MEMHIDISDNLKFIRTIFGYTQAEVAEALHMSRSTYARLEAGAGLPSAGIISDLARFYGVPPSTILQSGRAEITTDLSILRSEDPLIRTLLMYYRSLSPFSRGRLSEYAESLLDQQDSEDS